MQTCALFRKRMKIHVSKNINIKPSKISMIMYSLLRYCMIALETKSQENQKSIKVKFRILDHKYILVIHLRKKGRSFQTITLS